MPKWLKRQMSLGLSPVIPAGIGLRSDDGHPSGGGNAPEGQNDNGSGAGDGNQSNEGDDDSGKAPKFEGDFDPERAKRAIESARESERKAKAEAKAEKDRVAAILKAAGLAPDGKEDPEAMLKAAAAERDQAKATARQQAIELAVYKSAGKAGADPDALLDSRGFLGQLEGLDTDAKNFGDKVVDAIKKAVTSNPKLAAQQTPGRSGAQIPGGSGGRTNTTPTLDDAVAARYGM
jgi:hypothetical protein